MSATKPTPAEEQGSLSTLQDRMDGELMPMLAALKFATEAARTLQAFDEAARAVPGFESALREQCPEWRTWQGSDPLATVASLAALAHEKGAALAEAMDRLKT